MIMDKRESYERIIGEMERNSKDIKKYGVKKIGLFGSYLKGTQKKGSDVDILVEFDEISYDDYYKVLVLLKRLLKKKIDLVISESLRPELTYVKKEAIYAKL